MFCQYGPIHANFRNAGLYGFLYSSSEFFNQTLLNPYWSLEESIGILCILDNLSFTPWRHYAINFCAFSIVWDFIDASNSIIIF
jgi:hypothetical protein